MVDVHVLASGSDGNCVVVDTGEDAVMIDAGVSYKRIQEYAAVTGCDLDRIRAILVTHEHTDHIAGVPVTSRKLDVPVFCTQGTRSGIKKDDRIRFEIYDRKDEFDVGQFHVTPLPTFHDAAEPNAFFLEACGRKVAVVTDTGHCSFQIEQAIASADIAVMEANYDLGMLRDGPYPYVLKKRIEGPNGHMDNVESGNLLRRTLWDGRQVFLAHLSKTNNTPDVARDTVASRMGINRLRVQCMEWPGDARKITTKV